MRNHFAHNYKQIQRKIVNKFRSVYSSKSRVVSVLVFAAVATQVSGCEKYVSTEHIDSSFKNFSQMIHREANENKIKSAQKNLAALNAFEGIKNNMFTDLSTPPQLQGKLSAQPMAALSWVTTNRPIMLNWYDKLEKSATRLRGFINENSKRTYESQSIEFNARNTSLTLFALQYYRNATRTLVEVSSPVMVGLGSEELKDVKEVQEFKNQLMDRVFAQLGMTMVMDQDIAKTLSQLTTMKSQQELPKEIVKMVDSLQKQTIAFETAKKERVAKGVKNLSAQDQALVHTKISDIKKAYADKTLLYVPGSNSNVIINILTIIGNLTWGLCNTLIGLGIVIVTMIVSPFSDAVDFPTFSLSANGRQIVVDVNGMGPGGAMSMGIFDLTSGVDPDFANGHEGAHAIQSAMLGPLYLPLVIGTYIVSGFDQGFMEDWADAWADL